METKLALLIAVLLLIVQPQNALAREIPAASGAAPAYVAANEQSVPGVIEAVENRRGGRVPSGAYLRLLTPEGSVDVQLSPAVPGRPAAYGLLAGDRVEVTGCMISYKGQRVLLARQVMRGSQVLTFRNKLGFPVGSRGANGAAPVSRR
jgi:hypothetical protein